MSTTLDGNKLVDLLADLASVCIKFSINGFSIEENAKGKMIRGIGNKGKGMSPIVLCHPIDFDLPFQGLAVTNPVKLNAALNVFKTSKMNPTITLDVDPTKKVVKSFELKSGKTKLKYACGNPMSIESPKGVTDVPTYNVVFDEDAIKVISTGVRAIDTDTTQQTYITLTSDGTDTKLVISGMSKDELSYELPASTNLHTGTTAPFSFKYPVSSLVNFLNMSDSTSLTIGKRGVISNMLNGYSYHLFPII